MGEQEDPELFSSHEPVGVPAASRATALRTSQRLAVWLLYNQSYEERTTWSLAEGEEK